MRTSFLAATAVAAVAVVVGCAGVARRLRLLRRLRAGGVHAVATVRSVEERHVSVPSGFTGWVTTVAVSFTDGSGAGIEAAYAEYGARAASVGDPGGTIRVPSRCSSWAGAPCAPSRSRSTSRTGPRRDARSAADGELGESR
jgi:hypothetical protein